jgi:hypothetical protein
VIAHLGVRDSCTAFKMPPPDIWCGPGPREEHHAEPAEAPGRSRGGQDRRQVHRRRGERSGQGPARGLRALEDSWKHHHYIHWGLQKTDPRPFREIRAKVSEVTLSDVVPSADVPSRPFASEARLGQRVRQKNPPSGKQIFSAEPAVADHLAVSEGATVELRWRLLPGTVIGLFGAALLGSFGGFFYLGTGIV